MRVILNFLIDEDVKRLAEYLADSEIQTPNQINEDGFEIVFIYLHHRQKASIFNFLKLIPENVSYFIWFHLGKEEDHNLFQGVKNFIKFKRDLKNLKPFFLTSGRDNREISQVNSEELEIVNFGNIRIYIKEYLEKNNYPPYNYIQLFSQNKEIDIITEFNLSGDPFNEWLLTKSIDEYFLKLILHTILPKGNHFKIKVLTSGYSGAYVLSVGYRENNIDKNCVVKIDSVYRNLKNEANFSALAQGTSLYKYEFIKAHQKEPLKINNKWFVLSYDLVEGYYSLKSQISITSPDNLKKIYSALIVGNLENFQKNIGDLNIISSKSCWSPETKDEYVGLTFSKNTEISIINNIKKIRDKIKFLKKTSNNEIDLVENFVKKKVGLGNSIERLLIDIPVGRVHGDLHTENILIDNSYKNFRFIDFAYTTKNNNRHAFLDLAKLSLDSELNLVSDELFFFNEHSKDNLNEWIKNHNNWLIHYGSWTFKESKWMLTANKNFRILESKNTKLTEALEKAYSINNLVIGYIKLYAIDSLNKNQLNKTLDCLIKEFTQQFFLVRLHYLLKYIGYSNISDYKKLFAFFASLNTLNYFFKRNNLDKP